MIDSSGKKSAARVLTILWKIGKGGEDLLLVVLLLVMIGLAGLLILLRNVFDSGLIWGDELLRILILWLCLVGAVAASRDDNHINIDLLSRFLPPSVQLMMRMFTDMFTAVVCLVLAWYSWSFVRMEIEFGSQVLIDYPSWLAQIILPAGFGLIAYRYLWHFIRRASCLLGKRGAS
ncbi:MAG: TRAP transporter small permease [Desulfuromonadales bacterium]|nr:TRAP transporter small permease [Desulfuromonadales bacterium]MDT8422353.1 TRAP transporter small permease [Desulfuromonadales bacterium]